VLTVPHTSQLHGLNYIKASSRQERNGGEGREGLVGGGRGERGKGEWERERKEESRGIAPWLLGDRRPCLGGLYVIFVLFIYNLFVSITLW